MATSRRELSDAYEAQDLIIQAAQDAKRLATQDYRAHLDKVGMDKDGIKAEVEGFKKAYRRKMDGQKNGIEAVEHVDAIADEIYLEITSPAPRATHVAIDVPNFVALSSSGREYHYDAETGEITEPQSAPQAAQGSDVAAEPVASRTIQHEGEAQKVERRSPKPEAAGSIPATFANAGSSNGRTAGFDPVNAGSTPAPASNITTLTPKPLRPYCQNPGSKCAGQGRKHCWKCEKAHEGEVA